MYVRYHITFELWSGDFLLFCWIIGSSRFFISCFHLVDVFIKYVSKSRPRPFRNGDGGTKVSLYLKQKIQIFQYLFVRGIRNMSHYLTSEKKTNHYLPLIFSCRCLCYFDRHQNKSSCSQLSCDDLREVLRWNHHPPYQILPVNPSKHFWNQSCLVLE